MGDIRRLVPRFRGRPYVHAYTGSDEPMVFLPSGRTAALGAEEQLGELLGRHRRLPVEASSDGSIPAHVRLAPPEEHRRDERALRAVQALAELRLLAGRPVRCRALHRADAEVLRRRSMMLVWTLIAAMVLVLGPRRPFLDPELEALDRYLERGGSLLLALEPQTEFRMGPLSERLGVEFRDTPLADDMQHVELLMAWKKGRRSPACDRLIAEMRSQAARWMPE